MAAGQGFKTFTTGEVLTAGDVNGYLMQGINVFTNATARDAAITAPAEGQFAFTKDNNSLWYYDGAAWVASGATGDIEGVTAGTGLTGGGTSGTVTLAFDQANYGGGQYAAGKNKVINGDFNIWQRGTTFTNPAGDSYSADRYMIDYGTAAPTSNSITRQTFTPGAAPVAGYEGAYFFRSTLTTVGSTSRLSISQKIENVQTFAGQTVTLSFWAKADSARTLAGFIQQNFGSGGSATVSTAITSQSITTSWTRFSIQVSVPSISGKTIGTSSFLTIRLDQAVAAGSVLELWGLQLEAGSTATPFQTATGNIQGELALCQRYYQALGGQSIGVFEAANSYDGLWSLLTAMRTTPSISYTGTITGYGVASGNNPVTAVSLKSGNTVNQLVIACTGPTGGAGTGTFTSGTGSILASAEL